MRDFEPKEVKVLSEILHDNKPSVISRARLMDILPVYEQFCDNDIIMMYFDEPDFFVTSRWMHIEYKEKTIKIPRPQNIEEYIYICRIFCSKLCWSDELWEKFKGL